MTTIAEMKTIFQQSLQGGSLKIPYCDDCEKPHMYPKHICPFCQSRKISWRTSKGTGYLISMTVQRAAVPSLFADELPYAIGLVRLAEGVQLLARLQPSPEGNWNNYSINDQVYFTSDVLNSDENTTAPWFDKGEEDER